MASWREVFSEATANNAEIADAAREIFMPSDEFLQRVRKGEIPGGYNSIEVIDTAGASSMTVLLWGGNNSKTLVLPSNGSVVVNAEDGEYYQNVSIINNSGAAYAANKAFVNRSVKVRNGS